MKGIAEIKRILRLIDEKGYGAYKELKGSYDYEKFILIVDTIQSDPFATASRVRVRMPQHIAGFPQDTYKNKSREVALRDFIGRVFRRVSSRYSRLRGSGKSGLIEIDHAGQEVIERSSVVLNSEFIEVRFQIGLPAQGRRIKAKVAEQMLLKELPEIVMASLLFRNLDSSTLYHHIETVEDADYIRGRLKSLGLVAFVAEGANLPRASGVDPRPLKDGLPFKSPPSLLVEIETPNRGIVRGMGIPEGVTLIVGGGFHGKSTLLDGIKLGVYNHVPGDGRELVVSRYETVMIRAEDGRRVERVDISPFINNLPFRKSTDCFSTDNASGSTSQAANIMEALELGAEVLLIDEDTSATNFMIRDHRMQELIDKENEPITPFVDKVRQLYRDHGVSSIIVIGGSGDYFDVADRVLCMRQYRVEDCTTQALNIAEKYSRERKAEGGAVFGRITERIPLRDSLDPSRGRRDVKVSPKGLFSILFGRQMIELGALEQLVSASQTRAIGDALVYAMRYMDGRRTLREVVERVMEDIHLKGLDVLWRYPRGDYALFRPFELAGSLNRLRTLQVLQKDGC
ncbi:MAG: ATPase [Nitrospirae bacterium]|nr:MAG: ATPase [Nitrospirota bacterium]